MLRALFAHHVRGRHLHPADRVACARAHPERRREPIVRRHHRHRRQRQRGAPLEAPWLGKRGRRLLAVPHWPHQGTTPRERRAFRARAHRSPVPSSLTALRPRAPSQTVNVVRFCPNGITLASAGDDTLVMLWRERAARAPAFGEAPRPGGAAAPATQWAAVCALRGHCADVYDLAWSPRAESLFSGGVDGSTIVWNIAKAKPMQILRECASAPRCPPLHPPCPQSPATFSVAPSVVSTPCARDHAPSSPRP